MNGADENASTQTVQVFGKLWWIRGIFKGNNPSNTKGDNSPYNKHIKGDN